MPCYHPLDAFRDLDPYAKKKIKFPQYKGQQPPQGCQSITIPCGQCIGCRLARSREWAVRCVHEASLHSKNCFITLTYKDKYLPKDGSLVKKDFQKFMKRLRKNTNKKIRYYQCGEYGESCKNCGQNKLNCEKTSKCWDPTFGRPHYHAILFGIDFEEDQELLTIVNGEKLYNSETLRKIWGKGHVSIGNVTFESAAYVARYVMKKINGKNKDNHYQRIDYSSGEILNKLQPEYTTMSRRPGIASDWFKKYSADVFPSDDIHIDGRPLRPPKFYDKMFADIHPEEMLKIQKRRRVKMSKCKTDNTPERLAVKEVVKKAQLNKLKRSLEV